MNEHTYEFYGDNMAGRIRTGEPITEEMLNSQSIVRVEKFVSKKEVVPAVKPKKGEPKFTEVDASTWAPGFIRLSKVNIIYEIEQS